MRTNETPMPIISTTGTIALTHCVVRYSLPGENGQPPFILSIVATSFADAIQMKEAAANSEWQRYMTIDRPIMAEIIATGSKVECMHEASRLVAYTQPHCQARGYRLGRMTSNILCSNGTTYETQSEAAKALNLNQSAISAHLQGKLKQVKGYTFSYVTDRHGLTNRIVCSNGVTYDNQSDAAQSLGIAQGNISKHLRGELNQVGGYTFSYANG